MYTGSYCFAPNEAFDNRNKAYGAFWLRKIYNKRLITALTVGSIFFSLGVASPVIIKSLDLKKEDEFDYSKVVELKNLDQAEEQQENEAPPPVEAPPPPPQVATVRFVPPEVAPDEEVADDEIPPPQTELKEVQASTITQEGDPNANPNEIIVEDPVNTQATEVVGTGPAKEPEKEEVFVIVEQQPEFPGGYEAMQKFLQGEVNYPEIARKAGVEGRVFVTFVVGSDGAIRDVEVARGIGAGCDEEAIRAIKAMPKWIPGKQRGRAVSVRFSMPVTFKLR